MTLSGYFVFEVEAAGAMGDVWAEVKTNAKLTGTAELIDGKLTIVANFATPPPRSKLSALTKNGWREITLSRPSSNFVTMTSAATGTVFRAASVCLSRRAEPAGPLSRKK